MSLGPYSGDLKRLIVDFKFHKKKSVGRDIARHMAHSEAIQDEIRHAELLVAVPLHPLREKERGFNQSAVLAEELARESGATFLPRILLKRQPTAPQAQLGRAHRWESTREAFALGRGIGLTLKKFSRVILVDDVLTTGATAHSCALLLKQAGVSHVSVLAAARSVDSKEH